MSKLAELRETLCQDGVEYRELQSLAEIGTGSSDRKDSTEDGEYPFYVRSREVLRINKYEFDEEAIVIPGEGGIGEIFHFVQGKYALHQRAYRIHLIDSALDTRFLYYYMAAHFKKFIMQKAVSATVTSIRKPMIEHFPVPVPPLEVQREIIRMLDSFTFLSAELSTELSTELLSRRKQYEFYRNQLLTFDAEVRRISMGDLFDFKNGLSKGKEFFGRGTPFIRYTDVYNHRSLKRENIEALVECTPEELQKLKVSRGDVLFTRTSETAEDVGWSSVMLDELANCVFNGFTIKATPKTDLLWPEYCAYCFATDDFRSYVTKHCAFTTRASLTGSTIADYKLAVPSIDVQKRIADVLDNFEAIYSDLGIGLSTEIEARQKQYEYYRDKLLTFKEKD